jgi:hypothetical protein
MGLPLLHVEQVSACSVEPLKGHLPLGEILPVIWLISEACSRLFEFIPTKVRKLS